MPVLNLLHRIVIITLALASPLALSAPADAVLGLREAIDAAWQRSPLARTLEARRDEVRAGHEAAHTWIAGSPVITLGQRRDNGGKQTGNRETELSVSAPVWPAKQKSARQTLAQAGAKDLEAQIATMQLTLASEVRERMWAVVAARETLAEAQDYQQHLAALADQVMQRVKAGDLARTDGMLAQQEVLAARAAVNGALSRVNETLARYSTLTGQPDIPPPSPEPLSLDAPDPHPRMIAASTALLRAQAALDSVNVSRRDPPTIGLSMQREQDNATALSNRRFGVTIQIPIGTDARNLPLETAARTQYETASAEAAQTETALCVDIELARQQLAASQAALETASARTTLTREHLQLIEKAFRLGERGLADQLRAQSLAREAGAAERQQRVAVGLAHARLNQALGILP